MARSYKRDARGRFSGSGGGGGGSKGASTRAKNTARAKELKAKGTTGLGARLQAKGFSGGKGAQQRAGGLRTAASASGKGLAFAVGKGGKQSGAQRAATASAKKRMARTHSRSAQVGKPLARTSKSPVSAAKARYKELTSKARKSSPYRTAQENRAAAGAKRSLKSLIAKRGRR